MGNSGARVQGSDGHPPPEIRLLDLPFYIFISAQQGGLFFRRIDDFGYYQPLKNSRLVMKHIRTIPRLSPCCFLLVLMVFSIANTEIPTGYTAVPFRNVIQQIPGRFFVWRYDSATTRGVSWQTPQTTPMTGDYYQYDGRKTAGVEDFIIIRIINPAWDVYGNATFKNPANPADTNANPVSDTTLIYNDMNATKDGIYIGYIEHGEWVKSTVNVTQGGLYSIDLMLTSSATKSTLAISALNGTDSVSTGEFTFRNTGYYHNYQCEKNLATIRLKPGLQVIRTDMTGEGAYNLWFYRFNLVEATSIAEERTRSYAKSMQAIDLGNGDIRLDFSAVTNTPVMTEIFSAQGQVISSKTISSVHTGKNQIRLPAKPGTGVRFIRITQGDESMVCRIVSMDR
jgi:hypothetical protein